MKKKIFEDLNRGNEARHKILDRINSRPKKSIKKTNKKRNVHKDNQASHENITKERELLRTNCSASFADEGERDLIYKQAQANYDNLAADLIELSKQAGVSVNLLWPAFPSCVPAIHSISTCAEYERSNKVGLRAILYPAKNNAYRELNHIRINAQWLYEIAQKWQSLRREPDKYEVIAECEHKDILYLSLNSYLSEIGDESGFPSLGETFPAFPVGRDIWGDFTNKIFNGVFKYVSKKGNPLDDLGDPFTAPDGIFGIHPDISINEIKERLSTDELLPEKGISPKVSIINLNAKSRYAIGNNWPIKCVKFIKLCLYELPYSPIGVQVLIDDPIAYLTLLKKFNTEHVIEKNKHEEIKVTARTKLNLNRSISPADNAAERRISDIKLVSHVVDAEAAIIATELNNAAISFQPVSEHLSKSLRDCAGYLLWSARLPCGQLELQEILNESSSSDSQLEWKTNTYSWLGVVRNLEDIRSNIGLSDNGPDIDHLIDKATKMLDSYSSGTPSGAKLIELVGDIVEVTNPYKSHKKTRSRPVITIAVPSALQTRLVISLIERYFNLFDDYGNEVIQVIRTAELFSNNPPIIARRLIVIGARAQTIAELCSSNHLPKKVILILSAGDAERITKILNYIIEDKEFEYLHEPLKQLVGDLDIFLNSGSTNFSILSNLVYWRPQSHTSNSNLLISGVVSNPDYEFLIDDGRVIGLFKSSSVLIYDETRRPPFMEKKGFEVEIGDSLLIISEEMRTEIETYMNLAGRFKSEDIVRQYHSHVIDRINAQYPDKNQSQTISYILSEIKEKYPEVAEIPEHKVRYWISVDKELNQSFDQLLTHAPRSTDDFYLFMEILNIDKQLAELYWNLGINSLRNDRRYEGRQASLIYQRFLQDPISVSGLLSIPSSEQSRLLFQARSNLFEILEKRKL